MFGYAPPLAICNCISFSLTDNLHTPESRKLVSANIVFGKLTCFLLGPYFFVSTPITVLRQIKFFFPGGDLFWSRTKVTLPAMETGGDGTDAAIFLN